MSVTTYFNAPQNSTLKSDSDLTKAFERYGKSLFSSKFDFDYSNGNPADLAKNVSPSNVKRHFALYSSNVSEEEWFSDLAKQYLKYGSLPFCISLK